MRHDYVRSEHVPLGLGHEQDEIADRVLRSFRLTSEVVRDRVVEIVGAGEDVTAADPFTPRAKTVLVPGLRKALNLGHNIIGPEHLLLGTLRENEV